MSHDTVSVPWLGIHFLCGIISENDILSFSSNTASQIRIFINFLIKILLVLLFNSVCVGVLCLGTTCLVLLEAR